MSHPPIPDYSLTGVNAAIAVEKGLAEADWYTSPVPRGTMRLLLERRDGPAIRDTLLWFCLIGGFGYAGISLWGSWWAVLPFAFYGVLYASVSDSRWHESSHGTAFKTDWMNNALYEIASFMVMRESTVWRWSHTRHHSDTIIVGRDPEIAVPRPPDIAGIIKGFFNLSVYPGYFKNVFIHALGRMTERESTFIPESEYKKVYRCARIHLTIYTVVIASSVILRSWLPLLLIGLPNLYGSWLMVIYGLTQHAGLAENVLDHRLNCRTVRMNPLNRYLYWNMNYHVEHHMFPLVPYHALPRLHQIVKTDMPTPYSGLLEAYREIIPALLRQTRDPGYYVRRRLPPPRPTASQPLALAHVASKQPDAEGWIDVCEEGLLRHEDVIRFDHATKTYAIYRTAGGSYHATDGICTHGNTHLADGLVKGKLIECPKHNGRFNIIDGAPVRAPVCLGLRTYPVEVRQGKLFLNPARPGGIGAQTRQPKTRDFKVVSNHNAATFIKELVLEPIGSTQAMDYAPGDYLQFIIPTYKELRFRDFDIPAPFASVWDAHRIFDLVASNPAEGQRNNYSLASNPRLEQTLRFNIRIATPPPGQDCSPGIGSSYVFGLKPGDIVTAIGPFGDFHIKPTQKEMVYIGGGAGMAPLRAHISHLLETQKTARKISYWYGARALQEVFYKEYFDTLAAQCQNFSYHLALSEPQPADEWKGPTGMIHDVVLEAYLKNHPNLHAVEFYLCGPPKMIKACTTMLAELGVALGQIAYDAF